MRTICWVLSGRVMATSLGEHWRLRLHGVAEANDEPRERNDRARLDRHADPAVQRLRVHALEEVVTDPGALRLPDEEGAGDRRARSLEPVEARGAKGRDVAGIAVAKRRGVVDPSADDAIDAESSKIAVVVARRDEPRGRPDLDHVYGHVPFAGPPSPAARQVLQEEWQLPRRRVLDHRQVLFLRFAGLPRDHGRGRRQLPPRRELIHDDGEQAVTQLAGRQMRELPQQIRHVLRLEEDSTGVPVLRDAPVDVRVVLLALERDTVVLQLLQHLAKCLGPRKTHAARKVDLDPGLPLYERRHDGGDRVRRRSLPHGPILSVPRQLLHPAQRPGGSRTVPLTPE
jgi:hypothetical protein